MSASYVLTFGQDIHRGTERRQRSKWCEYIDGELQGRIVGIRRVGGIGGRVAELATALDMIVLRTKRDVPHAPDIVDEGDPGGGGTPHSWSE